MLKDIMGKRYDDIKNLILDFKETINRIKLLMALTNSYCRTAQTTGGKKFVRELQKIKSATNT